MQERVQKVQKYKKNLWRQLLVQKSKNELNSKSTKIKKTQNMQIDAKNPKM